MRPHRSSLFRRIFTRLYLAGILPLFAIVLIGVTLLFVSYRQSVSDFERTLLTQKRSEVERFVRETLGTFDIIVPYFEKRAPYNEELTFLLRGILSSNPELTEAVFVQAIDSDSSHPLGKEVQRFVREGEAPKRKEVDARKSYADLTYFRLPLEGQTYIGEVEWVNNQPLVTLAAPIRNAEKDVVGVIIGKLRLTRAQLFFQNAAFGQSGTVFLLDEKNTVVAHSGGSSFLHRGADAEALKDLSGEAHILSQGVFVKRGVLLAVLPIVATGWKVVAEWPLADAFAPVVALIWQVLLIGILLSAALFVFGRILTREIIRPIKIVEEGAARIGRGDFSKKIEVKTADELEDLGQSLNRMATDLSRLQEVRSSAIRARALAQAVEKEQELYQAKDVLLSTASHQFRTPVSVLNWNIELLKSMDLTKEAKELIEGISEHTKNLSAIANDLLNATAFGAGYVAEPGKDPVLLAKVLQEAIERYHSDAEAKKVQIKTIISSDAISIQGSYGALRIVAENLLSNAVTYVKEGGEVVVELRESPEGVSMIFRDNGIGIPLAEQKHMFQSFFRATNAIVAKNVGTGLGMFIAHNIVLGHGGVIDFSSTEGKGSEFIVMLPKKR